MQRDPRIRESVLAQESMILPADGVEVARDQSTSASRLAQEVGKNLHLLCTVGERVPK